MSSFSTQGAMFNPYAPPAYQGLSGSAMPGFVDVDFTYVYDVVLTANQVLYDQVTPIRNDADFEWRAMVSAVNTSTFKVRFSDSQGYYLSNGFINNANFLDNGARLPWTVFPGVLLPAGGKIGIDIQDTSGAENTIQLLFRGVNRYRIGGGL